MRKTFEVSTSKKYEITDITSKIESLAQQSGLTEGLVIVSTPHTSCSIILNESDQDLIEDIQNFVQGIASMGTFKHRHGPDPKHAASHIFSSIFGQSQSIPISEGQLLLGTWQRVSLFELDGPKQRTVQVTFIKESE